MNGRDDNFELTNREQQLLAKIEGLLDAKRNLTSAQIDSDSEICRQLVTTVPRANDSFRQQLEARLVAQIEQHKETSTMQKIASVSSKPKVLNWLFPTHPRLRRAFASLTILVLLMAGLILTVSPVQTWAQGVLDSTLVSLGFVKLGPVQTVQPGDPNSSVTFTQVTPVSLPTIKLPASLSKEEAQAQAGFSLKTPTYLPNGYKAQGFKIGPAMVIEEDGRASNPAGVASWEATNGGATLTLLQSKGNSLSLVLQNEETSEVKVGDAKGVFVQGHTTTTPSSQKPFVETNQSILAWEKDGILYRLISSTPLSLSEMLKVAEALR